MSCAGRVPDRMSVSSEAERQERAFIARRNRSERALGNIEPPLHRGIRVPTIYRFPYVLRRRVRNILEWRAWDGNPHPLWENPAGYEILAEALNGLPVYWSRRDSNNDIVSWRDVAKAIADGQETLAERIEDRRRHQRQSRKERRSSEDHLYLIAGLGKIKIGRSANPVRRLRDMQVGSPSKLRLVAVFANRGACEPLLHYRFKRYLAHGEWYNIRGYLARFVRRAERWSADRETVFRTG